MNTGNYKAGDMRDVSQEIGTTGVGNLAKSSKINNSWVCGKSANNYFWLFRSSQFLYRIKIKITICSQFVRYGFKVFTGNGKYKQLVKLIERLS